MSNLGRPETLRRCCVCDGVVNEFERVYLRGQSAHATCLDDQEESWRP